SHVTATGSAVPAGAPQHGRSSRRGRRSTRSQDRLRSPSGRRTTTRSGSTRPRSPLPREISRSTAASSSVTRKASRPASSGRSRHGASGPASAQSPTTSGSTPPVRECGSRMPAGASQSTTRTGGSASRGARAGWPLGVHAIGDLANREALDAFESTKEVWAPLGLRQRIEHAQCLADEDIGRFTEIGVACSVQFSHAPSDRDLADRFWAERAEGVYAFRSLLDSGGLLAIGSDATVEELDLLDGLRAVVLRTVDDRPAWHPEQALRIEDALRAATVNPAWLA